MDIVTYALCKNFVKKSLIGIGALKGSPCTIKSIVEDDDSIVVTFEWESTEGTKETSTMVVPRGKDGKSAFEVAQEQGFSGDEDEWLESLIGYSPTITVESDTDEEYILKITNKEGSFLTPNLKGGGGGDPEVAVQNTEPTEESVLIWVNPEEDGGGGSPTNGIEIAIQGTEPTGDNYTLWINPDED